VPEFDFKIPRIYDFFGEAYRASIEAKNAAVIAIDFSSPLRKTANTTTTPKRSAKKKQITAEHEEDIPTGFRAFKMPLSYIYLLTLIATAKISSAIRGSPNLRTRVDIEKLKSYHQEGKMFYDEFLARKKSKKIQAETLNKELYRDFELTPVYRKSTSPVRGSRGLFSRSYKEVVETDHHVADLLYDDEDPYPRISTPEILRVDIGKALSYDAVIEEPRSDNNNTETQPDATEIEIGNATEKQDGNPKSDNDQLKSPEREWTLPNQNLKIKKAKAQISKKNEAQELKSPETEWTILQSKNLKVKKAKSQISRKNEAQETEKFGSKNQIVTRAVSKQQKNRNGN
jgi:hypothetical protein